MSAFDATSYPRLKHHGKARKVVQEKYQRPKVQDLGTKWKIVYWDYSTGEKRKRSRVWAKSSVPTLRKAERLASEFMVEVNSRNNDPRLASPDDYTVAGLYKKCSILAWPQLKKPSIDNYEYYFNDYLLPGLGKVRLDELSTVELQVFFNSFRARLSPKSIKNMHATLRTALSEAVRWGLLDRNAAVGVKLPRAKPAKPPVVLLMQDIRSIVDELEDPTKAMVTLIVFASMRIGEVLALRWDDILRDRIVVDERLWEGDLDEPKSISGKREIPLDRRGVLKETLTRIWTASKHRQLRDFVFATRNGTPLQRRNVLRHVKAAAKVLGLPKQIDFRSFRTMHSSLMGRAGARPEVIRDNMGHHDIDVGQNIYGKSWWEERVNAVSAVVELLMMATEPGNEVGNGKGGAKTEDSRALLFAAAPEAVEVEPQVEP